MITDFLRPFVNFISGNLLIIQIVSFLISATLLGFVIFFLSQLDILIDPVEHFFDVLGQINIAKRRTLRAWKEIQKMLKSGKAKEFNLAIIGCDKLLGEILRNAGFSGKNLDEKLEQITPAQIENIEEIKQAHKLKQRITAEPDFLISQNEAQIAVDIYKKVFQGFNLID